MCKSTGYGLNRGLGRGNPHARNFYQSPYAKKLDELLSGAVSHEDNSVYDVGYDWGQIYSRKIIAWE